MALEMLRFNMAKELEMLDSLSFVLPMYNEEGNIETAVSEAIRVGYKMAGRIEVIVVDDASTDSSPRIVDRLADIMPEVKVIHHQRNRKLGGALKTGFAAASMEWILYIDSDLPIHMDDALQVLPLTQTSDVIIGWRKSRAESWRREFISKVYNRMIRYLFKLRVRDVNFAFKLFRRSLLDEIVLTSEGSFIDAELLLEIRRLGTNISEIGLDYYPRVAGVSTLAGNRVILTILREMFNYRLEAYGKDNNSLGGERGRIWVEREHQKKILDNLPREIDLQYKSNAEHIGVR